MGNSKSASQRQSSQTCEGSSYTLIQQERDTQALQVFLPYRCYCSRRQVPFETVVLYDPDVARALINYISVSGVETLLLGSSSRSGITRLYDEVSLVCGVEENEKASVGDSGRVSTDSNCISFYENLGSALTSHCLLHNNDNNNNNNNDDDDDDDDGCMDEGDPLLLTTKNDGLNHSSVPSQQTPSSDTTQQSVEEEIRRLKIELKQAIDMCHTAKHKCNELQEWKMEQERRMEEVKSEAMAMVEKERARCKEAIEAAQRMGEQELEKRVIRAMVQAEQKHQILEALGRNHALLKFHTFFHIFLLLLCSYYLYFSFFK
ncbi:U-box domain-containing protein 51 [Senna tora]|uniref:RING-type E3 ubiquitin transferase n=1 Tax=Senna tora TaxID=362788 RepID=A0A834TG10_9FABA|nr:U-box domain-containing protein 51 [Senna tora]